MSGIATIVTQAALYQGRRVLSALANRFRGEESYCGRMCAELAQHGQLTARQLAKAVGLSNTGRVSALLKNEVSHGRVRLVDGFWELVPQDQAKLHSELAAAASLLRLHGWKVEAPRG